MATTVRLKELEAEALELQHKIRAKYPMVVPEPWPEELQRWQGRLWQLGYEIVREKEKLGEIGNPGGVYWWVRLGDVAEYEQFNSFDEAKEHVEEATGRPFSEAHWINQYGFELGSYYSLNYISFFEGDEAAQPTEQHLYGKP